MGKFRHITHIPTPDEVRCFGIWAFITKEERRSYWQVLGTNTRSNKLIELKKEIKIEREENHAIRVAARELPW